MTDDLFGHQWSKFISAVITLVILIMLIVLGVLTWQQASVYQNNISFYSHIIALNPQARSIHYNFGNHLHFVGCSEEALAALPHCS